DGIRDGHVTGVQTCALPISVYVPNGRVPGSEHYEYKLAWLASLRQMVAAGPDAMIVCGDVNIAPTDDDVFDPEAYVGETHVTPRSEERRVGKGGVCWRGWEW